MKAVWKELFRAIHEGYWLAVEYHNQRNEKTSYWIAVKDLDPFRHRLKVDGMHLGRYTLAELNLHIERISEARCLEGTWAPVNERLVSDIRENPEKYRSVFSEVTNLRILNYLAECFRLDQDPYETKLALVDRLDDELIEGNIMKLNERQFAQIVYSFHNAKDPSSLYTLSMSQYGLNLLSIHSEKGKYVLAYQPLRLDVKNRTLAAFDEPVICSEFTVNSVRQSVRRFLDPEDLVLLEDFKANAEKIRELITLGNPGIRVDDMPYLIQIARDIPINLHAEYDGILKMYASGDENDVTVPVKAFFGELTAHARRTKSVPLALISNQVNLDQLLAMNHAMRHPVSYVQGPPGTGKTMTIVHTILSAFYNKRTVLFASYNNHPVDEAVSKLQALTYQSKPLYFPVIRLGSFGSVLRSLKQLQKILPVIKEMKLPPADPDQRAMDSQAKKLSGYLEQYENRLNLLERKEAAEELLKNSTQLNFSLQVETRQLPQIEKQLEKTGEFRIEDALKLTDSGSESILAVLARVSLKCLKKIFHAKNRDLLEILKLKNDENMVREFHSWLSVPEHLERFLEIFPVVATTCISARRLGFPEPVFDMVILDEASQCNTAVSLVPVIRGRNLLLVGDPQQLQPVILLDPADSAMLRNRYGVPPEYDYCSNSIYKAMLASDAVSDEVLLSHHYRCDPKIIGFNNRKYYNSKLKMDGASVSDHPLVYIDVPENETSKKNTAPKEAQEIIHYLKTHPAESVGIITPFVKQKELIQTELRHNGMDHVSCGTVHAFQGDEKDVILFSLGLSESTREETYNWLKNNRELINVSTSRARHQLIVISSNHVLRRLHKGNETDDLYDLVRYVQTSGTCQIACYPASSRALGIRPYSTETEEAFMDSLTHALDNAFADGRSFTVHREVPISQVFINNPSLNDFFYRGRFDFVVFRRTGGQEMPVLAIELDGKEHREEALIRQRDQKKEAICHEHGFELIRVDNTYARRYHYIKEILIRYFSH